MNEASTQAGSAETIAKYREIARTDIEELRDNYRNRAKWHRRWFRATGVAIIILSASLPLLAGLSYDGKDVTLAVVGVVIAILTGLRVFYQWDQLWGLLRQTDFALTHLLTTWELDVLAATGLPEPERSSTIYQLSKELLERADEVRQGESQKFFGALRFPGGATTGDTGPGVEPAK